MTNFVAHASNPTAANVALAEALGLDPNRIRKNGVTIVLDGDLGPVITVEYRLRDAELDAMFTALERYKLVPIEENHSS